MQAKSAAILLPALAVALLLTWTPGAWAEPASTPVERIDRTLESLRAELIEVHRDLHQHPELSGQEERTARVVAERLRGLGLGVRSGVGGHGVVGLLRGGRPGPVVAYRADMDAVTSAEHDPVAYRSQTPGVRHICGHDLHTTVALGIAAALASVRDELPGSVKLLFQPSEENGQGAKAMIDDGALEDPAPEAIFALHTTPLAVGQLGSKEGLLLPARNSVTMTLSGKGDLESAAGAAAEILAAITRVGAEGAAGAPETLGGIPLANDFIVGQPFRSEAAAEEQWIFQGMISTSSRGNLEEAKSRIAAGLAALALDDVAVELDFQDRVIPGAFNDAELVRRANETIRSLLGEDGLVTMPGAVPFFSEDFGHFQDRMPGAMYWLGVSNPERGTVGLPHSPEFVADEEAIFVGARAMAGVLYGYLEAH